ncbi:tetratricopeptide repeat protein [Limnospira fusiformis KN01]|uniref:tetratricopeptide repeat protein n=1 Tax=Limnospira fusiformis TaxID=54297 RepID=UPI0016589D4B|nr:tetratricopeptide repeat protein [Limnospira fusiformis]ULB45190.1 tetratricopeptide repeat protein [Limnospira fusiformis KN01]
MVSKFHEANQLARVGDLDAAVVAYRLAIEENSGIDPAYHNLGETLCKLERWDEAIAAFREGLALNPRARLSYFSLGQVFAKQQQWQEALDCFQEAIGLQLSEPRVFCALGVARMSLGCESEAFEALQKAIEMLLHQGRVSPLNQIQVREAIRTWQGLLDFYSVEVPARVYLSLSTMYRSMMDYGVADHIIEQGKERYPDLPSLMCESAEAPVSRRDWSDILLYWRTWLDIYPQKAPARVYLFMSLAYAQLRDYVATENLLLRGKQEYASFIDWAAEYAEVIRQQEDWHESLKPWQYLLDIYNEQASAIVYLRMSRVYTNVGRYAYGEQIILKGIEKYSDVAELVHEYIQIALLKQSWSEVIGRCQNVLARYQEESPAKVYLWMGRAYANVGDYEAAETIILQGREKYPNSIEVVCEYAQIAMSQQNWSEAIQRCQDILDVYPETVPAKVYWWMSQAWAMSGEYENAENWIVKGRERYPNSIELACEYAEIAMSQQNWSEFIQRGQAVLDNYPEKATAKVYVLMSMASAHIEDYVAAETLLMKGRQQYPNLFDLAGEYAKFFKAEGDISENLACWRDMLDIYRETAPVKAYLLLSRKYCKHGNYAEAENIILKGRSRYPDSWELASEYAQIAMYQQDFYEAIAGWNHVLDTYPEQAPSSVYVRLNRAYCSVKDYVAAEHTLLKGREKYANAMDIAYEYCYLPIRQKDFPEVIERAEKLLDSNHDKVPAKIYSLISVAYRSMGDYEAAETIMLTGMEMHPKSVDLAYEYAEIATSQRHWQEAIKRSQNILNLYQEKAPAKAYLRLSLAYRFTEDIDCAEGIIKKGLDHHPDSRELLREYAELAMVRRDWELALQRWQAWVGEISHEQIEEQTFSTLPHLSKTDDWLDCHWQDFAHYCAERIHHDSCDLPSASLLFVLVDILVKTDFWEEADSIGQKAVSLYPEHLGLSLYYAELSMKRQNWQEAIKRWSRIIQSFGNQTPAQVFLKSSVAQYMLELDGEADSDLEDYISENPYHDEFMAELKENQRILDKYKSGDSAKEMPIYCINYNPDTLLGYQIEYGNFLTPDKIGNMVLQYQSQKTGCINNSSLYRYQVRLAYRLARRFGYLYQNNPEMPKNLLADSVFTSPILFTEMRTVLQLKSLAKIISRNIKHKTIFISLDSDEIPYSASTGYVSMSTLTPFYLNYFLTKNNLNCFLSLAQNTKNKKANQISIDFVPSSYWDTLFNISVTEIDDHVIDNGNNHVAVVLNTIRSLDQDLASSITHSVACNNIYLSSDYSLGRHCSKTMGLHNYHKFSISLYADCVRPKTVSLQFEPKEFLTSINSHLYKDENLLNTKNTISRSNNSNNSIINLWDGLYYVLGDTILCMAKQARKTVQKYRIRQLHVGDSPTREAVIMTHAVKQAGGHITLWPHSVNTSLFHGVRNQENIDKIYSLTKTGIQMCRDYYPDVSISLVTDSILPPPTRKLKTNLNHPQTIVIIGDLISVGIMPILDLKSYSKNINLFLELLSEVANIQVVYKPKNQYTSSASFFGKIINKYFKNWKVTWDIPLKITYPNMIWVTIGSESTALLEGISRGIPAMIVRDLDLDFSMFDVNVIKTGKPETIIDEIIKCKDTQYKEQLIDKQMEYYCQEIGLIDRSSLLNYQRDSF